MAFPFEWLLYKYSQSIHCVAVVTDRHLRVHVVRHLDLLASHSGRRGPAHRLASTGHARLTGGNIDAIFASGLHEFLTQFIADNNRLGEAVAEQYLF
jgi:uncharacterized alpha-E superfamily protein